MLDLNHFSYSKDSLEIIHRDHLSYVRKTFLYDLERARRNVEKQQQFRPLFTGMARICAADVLEFQVREDRAELLMPYIEGISGHMLPVYATRNIARTLSMSLSTMLYFQLNESREEQVAMEVFLDKLNAVAGMTRDFELNQLIKSCLCAVSRLPSEMTFPMGPCHGDLTLSNVILDPVSGVTLIDFLDTYLETPLQDVAKLKQDFVYGWSFRKAAPALGIKAGILCQHHYPQAITQIEQMYPNQVRLLMMMTLARIAPYIKDDVTHKWLVRSLSNSLREMSV